MSPRLTDESRRERIEGILAAAARVFVERGYDRATLREVAGAAGVSTGAVYAYFRTKEELLLEICRRQAEVQEMVLQEALGSFSVEDGGFETSFRTALAPFLRLSEEETRRREMVNLLFWYESVREPELRALMRGAMGSWRQAVAGRVREEQRAGRLRADLDPEAFATVLFALPFGMQLYELLAGEGIDREAFVRDGGTVLQSGTRPADRGKRNRGMTRKAGGLPDSTPPGGHDASFVTAITGLLAFFGWLVGRGTLSWFRRGEESLFGTFSAQARTVLGVWLGTLAAFALVLPLASVVAWPRQRGTSHAMVPYALVLVVQIATEAIFSRLFFLPENRRSSRPRLHPVPTSPTLARA